MKEVIKIFKQLQNTSSKNEKERIIKQNKDNELFKECLVFLLDSNVVTGISKKKLSKVLAVTDQLYISNIHSWKDCMNYLSLHNTGTDVDIREMQVFIDDQDDEDKEFYRQMITKSLKLGCDSKTVNKAIPGLIFTWDVQLGSGQDKLKLNKNEWFSLSQKLNGNRCSYYEGKLISRQGKEFTGLNHILNDLKKLGCGYFYDGELIRKNTDGVSDNENFRIGTGIINSDSEDKSEIKFVIFDTFPEDEIKNKKSRNKYSVRKKYLEGLRETIKEKGLENVEIVEMLYEGSDRSQIDKWLEYAVQNDWEGLMLNKDTPYEYKRTTNLIKIKRFYAMDLRVIDILEGDGRLSGTLGALVVKYKNNTVNVGSGFTDEQREWIWKNKSDVIGKIVEVKYKEISVDKKTGLESLQFPVFVGLRNDKTEESYD